MCLCACVYVYIYFCKSRGAGGAGGAKSANPHKYWVFLKKSAPVGGSKAEQQEQTGIF